eukprot:5991815-Pyramimonas_sp.AAC.1
MGRNRRLQTRIRSSRTQDKLGSTQSASCVTRVYFSTPALLRRPVGHGENRRRQSADRAISFGGR